MCVFANRTEAGRRLAEELQYLNETKLVLAIPRGGVVVGNEIAKKINCSLDVMVSKKLTPPDHPEFAIGAIMHDGMVYFNTNWQEYLQKNQLEDEIRKKKEEVIRRLEKFRGNSKYELGNKTIILVDDGIATGATVFVILNWLSKQKPKKIIVAVPVMPPQAFQYIGTEFVMNKVVEKIIVLDIPPDFSAVGQFYKEFDQVSDEEVVSILEKYKN